MRNGPYLCLVCNKITKRKWNALRHNRSRHKSQGKIYDKLNNLVYSPQSQGVFSSNLNSNMGGSSIFEDKGKKNTGNPNLFNSKLVVKKANKIDYKSEEECHNEGIERLGLLVDELTNLLSSEPPHIKKQILDMMIISALSSQNPVNTFSENLSFCKNKIYSNKIIGCISSICDIPNSLADMYLKKSILREYKHNGLIENTGNKNQQQQSPE